VSDSHQETLETTKAPMCDHLGKLLASSFEGSGSGIKSPEGFVIRYKLNTSSLLKFSVL